MVNGFGDQIRETVNSPDPDGRIFFRSDAVHGTYLLGTLSPPELYLHNCIPLILMREVPRAY